MISLISRWQLLDGCPADLQVELDALPGKVQRFEPGTLMYLIHLQAANPLDSVNNPIEPPPLPITAAAQKEVIFVEAYKDEVAFSRHVNGPVFQLFLKEYGKYFQPDPLRPGWPVTINDVMMRIAGFSRESASMD